MHPRNLLPLLVFLAPLTLARPLIARDLHLHIIDDTTQKDIPNAKITSALGGGDHQTFTTDATGNVTIPLPDHEPPMCFIEISAPSFLDRSLWWLEDRITPIQNSLTIHLHKGTPAGGLITTTTGEPVPNAKVHLNARIFLGDSGTLDSFTYPQQYDLSPTDPVTTDSTGHWKSILPASLGYGDTWIAVQHNNFVFHQQIFIAGSTAISQLQNATLTLQMSPAAKITGTIRSPDAKPIANAHLFAFTGDDDYSDVEAQSAPDGTYHFTSLFPGTIKVLITAPAMSPQFATVTASAEKESTLDLTLKFGHLLTGTVLDHDQNPVPQAKVSFDIYHGTYADIYSTYSAADGTFSWPGAPDDQVQGVATAPGFQMRDQFHATAGATNNILLLGTTHLRITVLDQSTAAPIPGAIATGAVDPSGSSGWNPTIATGDPDGLINAYILSHTTKFYLRITAPNHLPEVLGPYKDGLDEMQDTVSLQPADPTPGTVKTPSGLPPKNVSVALVIPKSYCRVTNGRSIAGADSITHVDDKGNFLLQPHTENGSLLVLADEGFSFQPQETTSITLTSWATLSGTLMEDGKPLADTPAIIQWYPEKIPDYKIPHFEANFRRFTTDSSGHFTIDHLFPGSYKFERTLHISQGPGQSIRPELTYPGITPLAPGDYKSITLGDSGSALTAQLQLPADLPANWTAYDSMLEERRSDELAKTLKKFNLSQLPLTITVGGKIHLSNVPPGDYTITIHIRIPKAIDERNDNPLTSGEEGHYKLAYQYIAPLTITAQSPATIDLGTLPLSPATPEPPELP